MVIILLLIILLFYYNKKHYSYFTHTVPAYGTEYDLYDYRSGKAFVPTTLPDIATPNMLNIN